MVKCGITPNTNQFEGYQGGAWGQLGGGATGGGGDEVFVENRHDYYYFLHPEQTGKNAMSNRAYHYQCGW